MVSCTLVQALSSVPSVRPIRGVDVYLYAFLTTAQVGNDGYSAPLYWHRGFLQDLPTHTGSSGIALLFLDHSTRMCEVSASRPGHYIPPERPGIHFTEGWVGPRAGLDRCGKSLPHPHSIPGPSSS